MESKFASRCRLISNLFFWCTICAIPLMILSYPIGLTSCWFGANTMYIALSVGGFEENMQIVLFCRYWIYGFAALMIFAYILAASRKKYGMLFVLMVVEVLAVFGYAASCLMRGNEYGFWINLPDIVISVVMCAVFLHAILCLLKETRQISIEGSENGSE